MGPENLPVTLAMLPLPQVFKRVARLRYRDGHNRMLAAAFLQNKLNISGRSGEKLRRRLGNNKKGTAEQR